MSALHQLLTPRDNGDDIYSDMRRSFNELDERLVVFIIAFFYVVTFAEKLARASQHAHSRWAGWH